MSEEKIKELKALLEAAAKRDRDQEYNVSALGNFILIEAMFGGIVLKNTDGGFTVRVEV